MTPTIEEVTRVAIECGMFRPDGTLMTVRADVLQAFAQHYIEEGGKEQREKIATLVEKRFVIGRKWKLEYGANDLADAIRNNTGE